MRRGPSFEAKQRRLEEVKQVLERTKLTPRQMAAEIGLAFGSPWRLSKAQPR
jgi:hypothetical protein